MNWGNPASPMRILWLLTGSQYQGQMFTFTPSELFTRLLTFASSFKEQFYHPVIFYLVAALTLAGMFHTARKRPHFFIVTLLTAAGITFYALNYNIPDISVYYTTPFLIFLMYSCAGAGWLRALLLARKFRTLCVIMLLAAGLAAAAGAHINTSKMSKAGDFYAEDFGRTVFDNVEPGSLILSNSDDLTFISWYFRHCRNTRRDCTVLSIYQPWQLNYILGHKPLIVPCGKVEELRYAISEFKLKELVAANIGKIPVYVQNTDGNLGFLNNIFLTEPFGLIYRLIPPLPEVRDNFSISHPSYGNFMGLFTLAGHNINNGPFTGSGLVKFDTFWVRENDYTGIYGFVVKVMRGGEIISFHERTFVNDIFPASAWPRGKMLKESFVIPARDLKSGDYEICIDIVENREKVYYISGTVAKFRVCSTVR